MSKEKGEAYIKRLNSQAGRGRSGQAHPRRCRVVGTRLYLRASQRVKKAKKGDGVKPGIKRGEAKRGRPATSHLGKGEYESGKARGKRGRQTADGAEAEHSKFLDPKIPRMTC